VRPRFFITHHTSQRRAKEWPCIDFLEGDEMTETDKSHLLSLARKLHERAKEAPVLAETFRDEEARRMMSEVAERYVKLAERLENEA
jgi:hypothetical protein